MIDVLRLQMVSWLSSDDIAVSVQHVQIPIRTEAHTLYIIADLSNNVTLLSDKKTISCRKSANAVYFMTQCI